MLSQTKTIEKCSIEERIEFYELMQVEFEGVNLDDFTRDFNEKQYVMIVSSEPGKIVGFSTVLVMDLELQGKTIKIIFSGDTTIKQEYRDSVGFGIELSKFFAKTIDLYPSCEIYYTLISKGWRTYRVLPFYFKEFVPCYYREISKRERTIMNLFGYKKYPNNYIEAEGLLCFNGDTQRLRLDSPDAVVPSRNNPHVDYFFKRNPNYLKGTELICLAEVSYANLTKVAKRFLFPNQKKQEVS